MAKISNEAELKACIRELELRTVQQEKALKEIASSTAQSFKPANLVMTGLISARKIAMKRDVRSTAVNTFIGLAAGYVTRKFVVGKNSNIFKRTLGAAVQAGITKMVYRRLPEWQQKASKFISDMNQKSKKNLR